MILFVFFVLWCIFLKVVEYDGYLNFWNGMIYIMFLMDICSIDLGRGEEKRFRMDVWLLFEGVFLLVLMVCGVGVDVGGGRM